MKKVKGIAKVEIINDIISMIIQGNLNEGDFLPSIRIMSLRYHVSRGTILVVYKHLESIGYIQGFERSGYVVLKQTKSPTASSQQVNDPATIDYISSPTPDPLTQLIERKPCRLPMHFVRRWLVNYEKNHLQRATLRASSPITRFLKLSRCLEIGENSILLFPGIQEALTLIALFLKQQHDRNIILLEAPCSWEVRELFVQYGFDIIDISTDQQGLKVEELPNVRCATLLCMPTLHFPTATRLSEQRRERLYHWAIKNQAIIIEDDRYAMLSFGKNSPQPLFSTYTDIPIFYLTHLFELVGTTYNLATLLIPKKFVQSLRITHRTMVSTYPPASFEIVEAFLASSYFMKYLTLLIEERQQKAALARKICVERFGFLNLNFIDESGFCSFTARPKDIPESLIDTLFYPILTLRPDPDTKLLFLFPYALFSFSELDKVAEQPQS